MNFLAMALMLAGGMSYGTIDPQSTPPRVEQMPATYKALYCQARYQLWVWREDTVAAADSTVRWHWFKEDNGYPVETADGAAICLRRGLEPPKRGAAK